MLDEAAVELEILEDAVEVVVELLGSACLGSVAGVIKVLVRRVLVAAVRVRVMMLVLAGVVVDLLLGVGRARERGRVGGRGRTARGRVAAAVAGPGCRRQRRVDRGAVIEAVLDGREVAQKARGDRRGEGRKGERGRSAPVLQ